jgi:phage protein D
VKPDFMIKVKGEDVTSVWKDHVLSISVKDYSSNSKSSDSLSIVLADATETLVIPDPEVEIEVFLGYSGDDLLESEKMHSVGKFNVDEVSISGPPNEITISGNSLSLGVGGLGLASLKTRKTRTIEGKTLKTLAELVAADHQLKAEVDTGIQDIVVGTIQQTEESDTHMLFRTAEKFGVNYKIADSRIIFTQPGNNSNGGNASTFVIAYATATSWTYKRDKKSDFNSCVAQYTEDGSCEYLEVTVGSGDPVMKLGTPFENSEQAVTAARAFLDNARRNGAGITVKLPGRSDIFAGGKINLIGFPYELRGDWEIEEVEQSLSSSGFTTSITSRTV